MFCVQCSCVLMCSVQLCTCVCAVGVATSECIYLGPGTVMFVACFLSLLHFRFCSSFSFSCVQLLSFVCFCYLYRYDALCFFSVNEYVDLYHLLDHDVFVFHALMKLSTPVNF